MPEKKLVLVLHASNKYKIIQTLQNNSVLNTTIQCEYCYYNNIL